MDKYVWRLLLIFLLTSLTAVFLVGFVHAVFVVPLLWLAGWLAGKQIEGLTERNDESG